MNWLTVAILLPTLDASEILGVAVDLSAIGTASMALLQVVKNTFRIHYRFNMWRIRHWAGSRFTKEFQNLAMVGHFDQNPLYALPTAQLIGQLQAAAKIIVTSPQSHKDLLAFLIGGNHALACKFAQDVQTAAAPKEERDRRRVEVEHYIQRNFDGLQVTTDWWWAWLNRLVAIALSVVLTIVFTDLALPWKLSAGLVAGFIAPATNDLLKVVTSLRRA